MADGVPDFADLLAAFDAPAVSLQQIGGLTANIQHEANIPFGGDSQMPFNQQNVLNQHQGIFPNTIGFPQQNQLGQISAQQQGNGTQLTDDSMSSGSLGLLFLSDVESQLSDEGGSLLIPQQHVSLSRPPQQHSRQRPKQTKSQQRPNNTQASRSVQNVGSPASSQVGNASTYSNIAPNSQSSIHMASIGSQNAVDSSGLKMSASMTSPPFGIQPEVQSGQQKVNVPMGQFVHPSMHSTRQIGQQLQNPPRPLSAASSTSDHLSRPGSVPQPSPSCGSNHSGDPATPLTPQSYNAGTPQSYNAGTPQSYNAGTPQPYNAGTPQPYNAGTPQSYNAGTPQGYNPGTPQGYNPGTPQSNLTSQQHQRNSGYSDIPQQMMNPSTAMPDDNFAALRRSGSLQAQPSPIGPVNTSCESFSDLPTPLKEAFLSPISAGAFNGSNINSFENPLMRGNACSMSSDNSSWMQNMDSENTGQAVMAPNSLFTNSTTSKEQSNFIPSDDLQLNFGYDSNSFSNTMPNSQLFQRPESNLGTSSLTSKQNLLLDQLSKKQSSFVQQNSLDVFDPDSSSELSSHYPTMKKTDDVLGGHSSHGKNATMNMMNKANDAGAAAVKELFQSHYEAISPVSDYAMSPSNKSSLQDELPESLLFSPSKFTSQKPDLTISHGKQDVGLTDPVLMYLKHDDKPTSGIISNSYHADGNFPTSMPKNDWTGQFLTESNKDVNTKAPVPNYVGVQQGFTPNSQSTLPNFLRSDINSVGNARNATWTSSNLVSDNLSFNANSSSQAAITTNSSELPVGISRKTSSDSWKNLQLSPHMKKTVTKAVENNKPGNFGVTRRRSSSEKSKSSSKHKKSSSFDNNFGFESDDDAEPTICLKKGDTKSKKGVKQGNKSDVHAAVSSPHINANAGADLKDTMEHLKQLQQQQKKLMQMQQFQLRHGTSKSSSILTTHCNANAQASIMKAESYQTHASTHDTLASSLLSQPKLPVPNMPVNKMHKTPVQQRNKKTPSEFSAPASLTHPSIAQAHVADDYRLRYKTGTLSQPITGSESSKTSQSSTIHHQALPQFPSFLNNPSSSLSNLPKDSLQQFPTSSQLPLSREKPAIGENLGKSSGAAVGLPIQQMNLFFPPSSTSSIPIGLLPQYGSSSGRVSQSIANPSQSMTTIPVCQNTSSFPNSNKMTDTVFSQGHNMQSVAHSDTLSSRRPQPFDNAHFDLDWLHREAHSVTKEKYKPPTLVTKSPEKLSLPTSQKPVKSTERYSAPVLTTSQRSVSSTERYNAPASATLQNSVTSTERYSAPVLAPIQRSAVSAEKFMELGFTTPRRSAERYSAPVITTAPRSAEKYSAPFFTAAQRSVKPAERYSAPVFTTSQRPVTSAEKFIAPVFTTSQGSVTSTERYSAPVLTTSRRSVTSAERCSAPVSTTSQRSVTSAERYSAPVFTTSHRPVASAERYSSPVFTTSQRSVTSAERYSAPVFTTSQRSVTSTERYSAPVFTTSQRYVTTAERYSAPDFTTSQRYVTSTERYSAPVFTTSQRPVTSAERYSVPVLTTSQKPVTSAERYSVPDLTTSQRSVTSAERYNAPVFTTSHRPVTSAERYSAPVFTTSHSSVTSAERCTASVITTSSANLMMPFNSIKLEDHSLPLKQSLHTVHHIGIPKSQTVSTFNKDSVPVNPVTEVKHVNPKKHRILEGYPHSADTFKSSNKTIISSQANGIPPAVAHSVLDKQRRYSKEHANKKNLHRIGLATVNKSPIKNASNPILISEATKPKTNVKESIKSAVVPNKKEEKVKDDQAGSSMLSFFNSLLQEASESAADSLKISSDNKTEHEHEIQKVSAIQRPVRTEQKTVAANKIKPTVPPITNPSTTSAGTFVKHGPGVQTAPPVKKPAKKNRPAATVPFKRRPYPAIDDVEVAKVILPVAAISKPASALIPKPIPTAVHSIPVLATSSVSTIATRLALPNTSVTSILTVPTSTMLDLASSGADAVINDKPKAITSLSLIENSTSLSASVLPKLRITMFRSSKGQVIHQSSVVGSNAEAENVDSDHSVHRKHKKRKKRKKRKKLSSSDYDSSVSSMTSMSSLEPAAKLVQQAAILEEMATKILSKQNVPVTAIEQLPISVFKTVTASEAEVPKPAQKRKRAKGAAAENLEKKKPVKRAKISKTSVKKKPDAKNDEPIARYQPKSAMHSSSLTTVTTKASVTLPSTFHRAPGKLPLYLSTSEAKSATTVPTIQLVARNTKLLETVVDNKMSSSATVVSVKLPNTIAGKTFSTQLLPNTGVQYIIPGSRGQQRILLPNTSTPISMPVSIVSPLLSRSLTSSFLPMSSGNKPHFFSVPVSVTDAAKLAKLKSQESTITKLTSAASGHSATNYLSTHTSPTATGTLSGSRVTTKVAASLLPLQSTANSFQSTFSKLISSQNPVPRYVPPDPPENLKMDLSDKTQYQCLECKDTFMFNESLDCHYDRRCILIKVRCMQCNQNLVFLNKCKLLLHARQHSDKGGGMQFNNAHISPLPLPLCKPRSKEDFLNRSASYERRKSSMTSSEDENMNSSIQNLSTSAMACTDCNFIATNTDALEEHFQRHSQPLSPNANTGQKQSPCFTCDICSLPIPNQCSFNAHMRMHKRAAPHTCPECGQTFDSDGTKDPSCSENKKEIDFNLHLSIQCFHLSRMSCYKCRLCSSIFKNADLLRRHLEVRHLQTFYKCRDCPMAFKTMENISSHQKSAHGVVAATKMIHKCPLCDTVFTDNSPRQQLFLLQKHFEAHINHPSINITAYKCLFCNNIYERKSLLRAHIKTAHDVMSASESDCELTKDINKAKILIEKDNLLVGIKKVSSRKRSIGKSSAKEPDSKMSRILSPNRTDTVSNLRIASGILGHIDGSGKKTLLGGKIVGTIPARQPLKLRLKGMTTASNLPSSDGTTGEDLATAGADDSVNNVVSIMKEGRRVYPCGECSKELPSASARLNHVRLKHKGIRTLYCCPHCPVNKIRFAKRISLKKHLKKVHGVEEMKKQDVRIEYAKIPVGQRFDPAIFNSEIEDKIKEPAVMRHDASSGSVEHKVRKKITAVGRKSAVDKLGQRPIRHARRDLDNNSPYIENSDSEVEQITNKCSQEVERSDSESTNFSLLRFPENYTCAKCQYQSKDRLEFQSHIIEHREEAESETMSSSMQQCTECGLCFASMASHAKHMFIKHKIKRRKLLEKYDKKLRAERQANGSLPQSVSAGLSSDLQNGPTARIHRCSVCYRRFESDSKLRTHMRTHGLAFVKSKHVT